MGGMEKLLVEFARHADRGRFSLHFLTLGEKGAVAEEIEALGWPVEPRGLIDTLVGLRDDYPNLPPVYITENGCAFPPSLVDNDRIAFIDTHLDALAEAMAAGVDVRGYFYWSLLDNFEWALGYDPRFGLVQVDYDTLVRTPRASYRWYAEQIGRSRRS